MIFGFGQKAFGVERGHAAHARGGHRLAIDFVGHVARREDARDRRQRRARRHLKITIVVQRQLALEQLGRGAVADRDEAAIGRLVARRAGGGVDQVDADEPRHAFARDETLDLLVPQDLDLRIDHQPVLQNLFGAQAVAAVDQRHIVAMVGQVKRLLHRGVAAADHHDLLAAIEEAVARRAGRNALAAQLLLARNAEPFRLRAGRDHQRFGHIDVAAVAGQLERAARQVDVDDRVPDHARADVHRLRGHLLHQPRALNHLGETRIIFDVGGDRQLAAGLQPLHHDRHHARSRGIDGGREAGGTGTEDEHLGMVNGGHGDLSLAAAGTDGCCQLR